MKRTGIGSILTNKLNIIFICIIIISIIELSPILSSGLTSDDAFNSLTKGILLLNNENIFQYIYNITLMWFNSGRFFPLSSYAYIIWILTDNLIVYKSAVVLSIIVNIVIFGYLVKLITGSRYLSILSMALPPTLFRFSMFHDPFLGFCMITQITFFFVTLSLIFLMLYLKKGTSYWLFISALTYLVGNLTYEIILPFIIVHIAIIVDSLKPDVRKIVKVSLPYCIVAAIITAIPFLIRKIINMPLTGGADSYVYVANIDITEYLWTLLLQTTSAIPGMYYLFDPWRIFSYNSSDFINSHTIVAVILILAYFAIIVIVLSRWVEETKNQSIPWYRLTVLGFLLLVLPGVLISFSPKYQVSISPGVGYLPIYISFFGITLLAVTILGKLVSSSRLPKPLIGPIIIVVALIFSLIGAMNYDLNNIVVENSNIYHLYPRALVDDSIQNGLFKEVGANSSLFIDSNYPWDQASFYRMKLGNNFSYVGLDNHNKTPYGSAYPIDQISTKYLVENNDQYKAFDLSGLDGYYYLDYAANENNGYAVLGKILRINASSDHIYNITSKNVYIYVQGIDYNQNTYTSVFSKVLVTGKWLQEDNSTGFTNFILIDKDLTYISSGTGWAIYSLNSQDKIVDPSSINVNLVSEYQG